MEFSPVQSGLYYARTDIGGAYRWDGVNNVWIPLTDWILDWNLYGIESLAPDPKNANVVYAAIGQNYNNSDGYILASSNQGNTWTQYPIGVVMGGNADGRNAGERLAVDPNLTSKLYFASRSGGLWVSTNSAATWSHVTAFPVNGDSGYGLSYVIFGPGGTAGTASPTIFVGVEAMGSGNSNLYRSTNSGASWTVVPGGPSGMITPHADLGTDGNLWVVYDSGGYGPNNIATGQIWKLNTATLGWTNVTPAGGPPGGSGGYGGISVDAQNAQHIVTTTLDWWSANDKVFGTTNGGASWTTIGNVSKGYNAGPFASYNNNGAIWTRFCSIYDGGAGWMGDIRIDPFNSNHAIYTTGGGVWDSANIQAATQPAGVTWTFLDYGLEETSIQDMTSSVAGGTLFSAMLDLDGLRHNDITQSPALGMYCNPSMTDTNGIDFAELNTNFVVREGEGWWTANQAGAYSTNNGTSWTVFPANPNGAGQYNGNGQISVNADGSVILWSIPGNTPAYSTNNGTSWNNCGGLPNGAQIGSDRANRNIFYGISGTSLYVSTNGGASFSVAGAFTGGLSWANRPRAVFGIAGEVWVPTGNGLYRFTNVGLGTVVTTQIANVSSAAAVGFGKAAPGYTHPAVYLVGTVGGQYGFFRCDDGVGTAWTRINDNNHQYGGPSFAAGDESVYGRMYIGTNGRGILYVDTNAATTPTPTPTATRTATATATPTVTFTKTQTVTATPSFTSTLSPTGTATRSPTATSTMTTTVSPTATKTITATPTQTLSPTVTLTAQFTSTATLSPTPTLSPSPTVSITKTWTASPTGTATSSPTVTKTITPTPTASPSLTASATATQTLSPTATPTLTLTPTLTMSPSPTATPTLTLAATATRTPTSTPPPTNTATPTASATPTPQATLSLSLSAAPSNVAPGDFMTDTIQLVISNGNSNSTVLILNLPAGVSVSGYTTGPSGSISGNQVFWNLGTLTPGTYTFGVEVTVLSGASGTLSAQAGVSAPAGEIFSNSTSVTVTPLTSTPTATAQVTPVSNPVLYPNPVSGPGPVSIRLPNYPGLADISVKVYTTAFRLVDKFTAYQMAGGSDVSLPLTDQAGAPLANGLYYVSVTTPLGRSIEKLLIIR